MWQNKWSSPTQRRLPFFESKIRTRRFHSSLHYFLITIYTHKTSSATQQSLYLFPNYLLLVIHQPFQCWKADKAKQIRVEVPFDLRTLFHPSPYQQVRSHYLSLEMLPCKQDSCLSFSLRKQTTFREPPTFSPRKWRLRKDSRNSILMTRHYTYLGSDASSCDQYGLISALVFQTSFRGETVLLALRNVCFLRLLQLLLFHPVRINSRRPWNLDSWPWILDSRYWIPVFQSWIPDFLSCIPDSKVQDFWFHKQKFPGLRNPDSLTRAYLLFYGVK